MTEPKRHHFVPRFYLRRFADESQRIMVRVRGGATYTTSTRNVMAQMGLYRVPERPQTAEYTLSNVEAEAADAFEETCSSETLPGAPSDARRALTIFMALQLSRSPDNAVRLEFARNVMEATGSKTISHDEMREYLEQRVLGFRPRDHEVQAACDLVNYEITQVDFPDRASLAALRIRLMFDLALQHTAPHLEARQWSLESSRKKSLITSDRPVTLWHPPSDEDRYRGVGILDATEIWLPLDPSRMLVLRKTGPERVRRIGPERVEFVNRHMARHRTSRVAFHPTNSDGVSIPLARRRPTMRFWEAPAVDARSGQRIADEVLHMWSPIRDIPDDVADPYSS